ncbi:CRISPR-associated helicase Cas3' [Eubacterium sp. 1001713B170207_170306_E7]|uniref:CRISPR-associated helicase Cas3' n=1 Tax=Eubacterium sp. 1001713B170207_170306_E7 TaxID=2787097 RepID=UPI00189AD3A3|nr:CRISPR-associated helicase Cas3' [Eubacterium sp. 1001713B170207_170306_E7]
MFLYEHAGSCFDNTPLFDFEGLIQSDKPFYAHIHKDKDAELLEEHMRLALDYFTVLNNSKHLEPTFLCFENTFLKGWPEKETRLWREMIINTIYMHDMGKINPNFQVDKMGNKAFKRTASNNSGHSRFSAMLYFDHYFKKLGDIGGAYADVLIIFLLLNTFIIQKHHGSLNDFSDFLERLDDSLRQEKEEIAAYKVFEAIQWPVKLDFVFEGSIEVIKKKQAWQCVDFYIYTRFLYGILVACDFYATSEYMNGVPVDDFGVLDDIAPYLDAFNADPITKNIRKIKKDQAPDGDINILRSQLFLEAEENLLQSQEENVVFLEAPTGSGKTKTSINLALQLIKKDKQLNRIFYVFPFNTLVEQTRDALEECFGKALSEKIGVINSITPIKKYGEPTEEGEWDYTSQTKIDYEKSLLARQFMHYPIVLTTHVKLFEGIFGTDREAVFPLAHLANSVIILDEIQSYRNQIWKEIIIFLKAYARILNFKVIIMSATLPDLNRLSVENEKVAYLVKNREIYFQNPLFKNRVELDFSMLELEPKETFEALLQKVLEVSNTLRKNPDAENKMVVEFIKKASAIEFYNRLKEAVANDLVSVELMTGDDHKAERKRIINQVRTTENIILVATQVIEAGVDIDMDVGFKDTSILDAEEQFLGRINRSCRKKGAVVYFYNLDSPDMIYQKDIRKTDKLRLTRANKAMQEILINKEFTGFYDLVLEGLEAQSRKENDLNLEAFRDRHMWTFNFPKVQERMRLIDDNQRKVALFLNTVVTGEDGEVLIGNEVWKDYEVLLQDAGMSYAEKRVRLSEVQAKMDYFIYEIDKSFADSCALCPDELLGELYYFEDGARFFENGKFSREKLKRESDFL